MANEVELAWLIDPTHRTVTVYRPGHPPEVLANATEVAGEGPVNGFTLELEDVWNA